MYLSVMPQMLLASDLANRFLNRRTRHTGDKHPLFEKIYLGRYKWMTLNNIKVSHRIYETILENRHIPEEFSLDYNKRLAVIIPFRDREEHLRVLIPALRKRLSGEGIENKIFVINQVDKKPFNRAKLINVGVSLCGDDYDYYSFHDVDMLPVDCTYGCPSSPLRPTSKILRVEGTRRISNIYFGGIVNIRSDHFRCIDGLSNNFWHWGKEDDNFLLRLLCRGLNPAIDTQGTFSEIEFSSSRNTVPTERGFKEDKARARAYINKNRRYQAQVARGLIELYGEGLSTLDFKLLDTIEDRDYTRLDVTL